VTAGSDSDPPRPTRTWCAGHRRSGPVLDPGRTTPPTWQAPAIELAQLKSSSPRASTGPFGPPGGPRTRRGGHTDPVTESYVQVSTTTDSRAEAGRLAELVVERRLAACAQILGPMHSTYRWKDAVEPLGRMAQADEVGHRPRPAAVWLPQGSLPFLRGLRRNRLVDPLLKYLGEQQ
jgi:hypothetical protein